jgi:hypothetical protein
MFLHYSTSLLCLIILSTFDFTTFLTLLYSQPLQITFSGVTLFSITNLNKRRSFAVRGLNEKRNDHKKYTFWQVIIDSLTPTFYPHNPFFG